MTVMQRVRALEKLARTAVRFSEQMYALAEEAGVEVDIREPTGKKRGRPTGKKAGAKGKRKVRGKDATPARPNGPDDGNDGDDVRYSRAETDTPPF